jgi:hypothetical protein
MKRREFLAASCIAGAAGLSGMASAAGESAGAKQYLELRHYELASAEKQKAFDDFLAKAAIPALNRLGIAPVGVFKMANDEDANLWVLIPHNSLESVAGANTKMLADKQYQKAGSSVLNCPKKDPAYQRVASSLLLAFDKCPKVEVPSKKDSRLFQLRIYESHNTTKAKRKIEMFNKAGEIALFRRTGLNPVFFGESIIGGKIPNLTYMVGFDDTDAKEKAWATFIAHPKWKKMSSDPYYKDTVSNITNLVLRPTAASQI